LLQQRIFLVRASSAQQCLCVVAVFPSGVNLHFFAKGECAAGWFSPFCLESRVHVPGLDRSHSLLARRQDLSYHFRCLLRPIHRRLVSVQRAIPDSFFGVEFTGRSSVAPTFCWLFPVDLLGPLVFSPTCSSVPLGCTAPTSLHFSVGAASGVLHLIFCSPVQLSADILHTGVPLTMAQRWWPLYSSCSCVSRQEQALQELPSLTVFVSIQVLIFSVRFLCGLLQKLIPLLFLRYRIKKLEVS
jgi:hypothetical protein